MKDSVVFTLNSIHHVLKGEKVLKKTDLTFDLVPVPKEVNPDCGMAIETVPEQAVEVSTALTAAGLEIVDAYRRQGREFTIMSTIETSASAD